MFISALAKTPALFEGKTAQKTPQNGTKSDVFFGRTEAQRFATGQMQAANYLNNLPSFAAPAFNARFHADRRAAFLKSLPPNTTVIVAGNTLASRNSDVTYKFRQDSNFYYLTGFDEPDALAIFSNEPGRPSYTLVVPPRDAARETWDGKRAGVEGAKTLYGAEASVDNTQTSNVLRHVLSTAKNIQVVTCPTNEKQNHLIKTLAGKYRPGDALADARETLHDLRIVKTPYELALLKRAVNISVKGHLQAMQNMKLTAQTAASHNELKDGLNEGVIQAEVEKPFRQHGAVRVGYESINGAGANGCILHYVTNNENAKPGDLVLVDAGAEYGYYTADVTRTWPLNGKFSEAQKAIYDIVLEAQESGIQKVKPGTTMGDIHRNSQRVITKGLMELGILQGDASNPAEVDAAVKAGAFRPYFMHGTSHLLGMDVHDLTVPNHVGARGNQDRPLEPGMTFTVEPGIYISPEVGQANGVDPKWWGIGVRIEDDILCTSTGFDNLSGHLPRTTDAIEALMSGRSKLTQTLGLQPGFN